MIQFQPGQSASTSKEIAAYTKALRTKQEVMKKADEVKTYDQSSYDLSPDVDKVALQNERLSTSDFMTAIQGRNKFDGVASYQEGRVTEMALDGHQGWSETGGEKFRYSRQEDGSQIFAAPAGKDDDYQVVMEKPNGTLFIEDIKGREVDWTFKQFKDGL